MLKDLHKDVVFSICQFLDTCDLFSFFGSSKALKQKGESKPLFILRAKHLGIYDPSFKDLEPDVIKNRILKHMKDVYRAVSDVFSKDEAPDIARMILEDDRAMLESRLQEITEHTARVLMLVAIKFGRLKVIHSLFSHSLIEAKYDWLMYAVREEQYVAVKYFVEERKAPLITAAKDAFLSVENGKWFSKFQIRDKSGRSPGGTFLSYNVLLMKEIIQCRHPEIVSYLRKKLEKTIQENDKKAEPIPQALLLSLHNLFAKVRRHSLGGEQVKTLGL